MNLLSGGNTPVDSSPPHRSASGERTRPRVLAMAPRYPELLRTKIVSARAHALPNPLRNAGFDIVWRSFAAVASIGLVFFTADPHPFPPNLAVSLGCARAAIAIRESRIAMSWLAVLQLGGHTPSASGAKRR